MSGILDHSIDLAGTNNVGAEFEDIGARYQKLLESHEQSAEYIVSQGMRGESQVKFQGVTTEINPTMIKQAMKVISLAGGFKKMVTDTVNRDKDNAGSLNIT